MGLICALNGKFRPQKHKKRRFCAFNNANVVHFFDLQSEV